MTGAADEPDRRPLRVLLLSPVAGRDPATGDVTYTEQLLADPPPGVRYTTYDRALAEGTLVERYRRGMRVRTGGDALRLGREVLVNRLRGRNVLFREPFRFFDVDPDAYDLVHVHVFSVRLAGGLPVVLSNAVPIDTLYRDAFGGDRTRTRLKRLVDERLARRVGVTHSSFEHRGADTVVCFSEHLRQCFIRRGGRPDRYVVVPPGIHLPAGREPLASEPGASSEGLTVGFVGDWTSKGGETVLAAHRRLRAAGLMVRLVIVGSEPRMAERESAALDVTWLPRLPREQLLDEVLPTFDVFAYPTRFDGLPLTLLEAMAAGVPPIVSNYGAMPEVVQFGRAGRVVARGDSAALAAAVLELASPEARDAAGRSARERVRAAYATEVTREALGAVYVATRHRHLGSS